ncbi:MAG: hypothetical protein JWO38_3743 [Gemmataceae bacterium]|nr:hypothetical protein [Gemmataceae bacterium]
MSTKAPPKPGATPHPERDPLSDGPPEEEFWERFNSRLEFPLSTVTAVLLHVVVGALVVWVLIGLARSAADKSSVPVKLIDVAGMDDAGEGSMGSGGINDPLKQGDPDPWKENLWVLPDPSKLPEVKQEIRDAIKLDDPNGQIPISDANAPQYAAVDKELAKKLLGVGANKGAGPGQGKGFDGTPGSGPGGTGADSSRARSLRWVLRFRTSSGDDYVAQLAAMGAVILVPLPPENKQAMYFADLKNLTNKRMATDDDLKTLANQIKFSDTRADSVGGVCNVLGVKENARSFWAFFPKGMEVDLAQKEIGYRNRRPEDIEETVFRVIIRGGSYEIVVDDQTAKR